MAEKRLSVYINELTTKGSIDRAEKIPVGGSTGASITPAQISANDYSNAEKAKVAATVTIPNYITQSGPVTIPDFTTDQKILDFCQKIDIVIGDEETPTVILPETFNSTSSNGNTFDETKTNIFYQTWIKGLGKSTWYIEKLELGTAPADTTAPTFVVNTATGVGQTAATFNVRINEAGTVKWMVTVSATPPTKSEILAGTGQVGSNHGSVTMISNVTNTASITGLTASTPYYLYFYAIDTALNETSVQSAISFTTSSTADTTPPTYNVQTVTSIAATTASFNVQINEAGTVYWMLTTSSTPPSKSAIVAGTGQVGSNHGATSVTANSTAVISLTGLTGSTQYYLYSYAEDSATTPNQTAVQSSISVLTISSFVNTKSVSLTNAILTTQANPVGLSFGSGGTDSVFTFGFYADYINSGGYQWVYRLGSADVAQTIYYTHFGPDDTLTVVLLSSMGNLIAQISDPIPSDVGLHHFGITYDASKSASGIKIYRDGVLLNSTPATAGTYTGMPASSSISVFSIGALQPNQNFYTGLLDELAIFPANYNQAQITALYNSGQAKNLASLNPVGWYRFENNLLDSGTNNYPLTNSNAGTMSYSNTHS